MDRELDKVKSMDDMVELRGDGIVGMNVTVATKEVA